MACLSRRYLFAVQLIFIAVSIYSVEVNGANFGFGKFGQMLNSGSKIVTRSLVRVPSAVMDGGQYATHMIGGTVSNVLGGVKPLKTAVDATSGALSNVMGSVSRLLGKPVVPPQEAMFLYQSVGSIRDMGTREQQEAAKTVLGYVLTNVVLYESEMQQKGPFGLETMRRLNNLAANLKKANASQLDIDYIVKLLSRNYRLDVPAEIESKIANLLINSSGKFISQGFIDEIRFIAKNPKGFYRLDDTEKTDYKLDTNKKYKSCTVIRPPNLKKMVTY